VTVHIDEALATTVVDRLYKSTGLNYSVDEVMLIVNTYFLAGGGEDEGSGPLGHRHYERPT
jgi:hypothetical protein